MFLMQIAKKEVDNFRAEKKRIPACQLQAVKSQMEELSDLFHSLKLKGTKCPHDYMTVFRPSTSGTVILRNELT